MVWPPPRRRANSPPFPRPTGTNLWQSAGSGSGPTPRRQEHGARAGSRRLQFDSTDEQGPGFWNQATCFSPGSSASSPSQPGDSVREAPSPQLHNGDAMTSRATGSSNGGDEGVTQGTAAVPV